MRVEHCSGRRKCGQAHPDEETLTRIERRVAPIASRIAANRLAATGLVVEVYFHVIRAGQLLHTAPPSCLDDLLPMTFLQTVLFVAHAVSWQQSKHSEHLTSAHELKMMLPMGAQRSDRRLKGTCQRQPSLSRLPSSMQPTPRQVSTCAPTAPSGYGSRHMVNETSFPSWHPIIITSCAKQVASNAVTYIHSGQAMRE